MAWAVKHDRAKGIVEVVYTGHVTRTDLTEAVSRRIRLQQETGIASVLIDASGIEQLSVGTLGLFELPDELYAVMEPSEMGRIAMVLPRPPKAREDTLFYETACVNRGWMVKTFEERQDAIDWLMSAAPSMEPDA